MFALVKDVKENSPLDVGTSFSLQTCWHMLAMGMGGMGCLFVDFRTVF